MLKNKVASFFWDMVYTVKAIVTHLVTVLMRENKYVKRVHYRQFVTVNRPELVRWPTL